MSGIIVIDKAQDYTSFDVVAVVRRLVGIKKVGHTGTLDPMATGVLPILVGSATKLAPYLVDTKKEYVATMVLGRSTDTLDVTGTITEEMDASSISFTKEQIEAAMAPLRGDILQVPPMFSALKKDGKRLYDLARQGITLELEPRPVTIYELELLEYQHPIIRFRAVTSKGTYIRSLVRDLAENLGVPGTMSDLRRTLTGGFSIAQSVSLDELKKLDRAEIVDKMRQVEQVLVHFKEHHLSDSYIHLLLNGVRLKDPAAVEGLENGMYRIKTHENKLIGLAEFKNQELVLNWRA
ncbi:MAG: tRNA pseudouridine(55) synthase TruB [Clostridium sp.]|jgi:tRNA pseudouridine55 synthase|nr:tRNA pseudouridine(55) synthase TruB [Clostridium sp.]